jgi:hypothetical protein
VNWSNVAAAAIGGVIGVVGALFGKRWDDQRTFRRDKAERLKALFGPIVVAASSLGAAVLQKNYRLAGQTEDQAQARVRELAKKAMDEFYTVVGSVMVEPGAAEVSRLWGQLYEAARVYLHDSCPGPDRAERLAAQEAEIRRLADELQALRTIAAYEIPPSWRRKVKRPEQPRPAPH